MESCLLTVSSSPSVLTSHHHNDTCLQVQKYCAKQARLSIVGYYFGNIKADDTSVGTLPAQVVATISKTGSNGRAVLAQVNESQQHLFVSSPTTSLLPPLVCAITAITPPLPLPDPRHSTSKQPVAMSQGKRARSVLFPPREGAPSSCSHSHACLLPIGLWCAAVQTPPKQQ